MADQAETRPLDIAGLSGRVALVTGAAGGIGRAIVEAFVAHGVAVGMIDIDADALSRSAAELSQIGRVVAMPADVSCPAAVQASIAAVVEALGPIDILVNCAGIVIGRKTMFETSDADWQRLIDVNLRAAFLYLRDVGQRMSEAGVKGRIVNIASSSAFRASFVNIAYAASKAGIGGLTRGAAAELGPYGISVNSVAPGLTLTAMADQLTPDKQRELVTSGPLANLTHRVARPEDVANAVLFLCLPSSGEITGQTLHTSGGQIV